MSYRLVLAVLTAFALASPAAAATTAQACAKNNPLAAAALAAVDACLTAKAHALAMPAMSAKDLAKAAADQCMAEQLAMAAALAPCATDPAKDAAMTLRMAEKAARGALDLHDQHGHGVDAIRDPDEDRR